MKVEFELLDDGTLRVWRQGLRLDALILTHGKIAEMVDALCMHADLEDNPKSIDEKALPMACPDCRGRGKHVVGCVLEYITFG